MHSIVCVLVGLVVTGSAYRGSWDQAIVNKRSYTDDDIHDAELGVANLKGSMQNPSLLNEMEDNVNAREFNLNCCNPALSEREQEFSILENLMLALNPDAATRSHASRMIWNALRSPAFISPAARIVPALISPVHQLRNILFWMQEGTGGQVAKFDCRQEDVAFPLRNEKKEGEDVQKAYFKTTNNDLFRMYVRSYNLRRALWNSKAPRVAKVWVEPFQITISRVLEGHSCCIMSGSDIPREDPVDLEIYSKLFIDEIKKRLGGPFQVISIPFFRDMSVQKLFHDLPLFNINWTLLQTQFQVKNTHISMTDPRLITGARYMNERAVRDTFRLSSQRKPHLKIFVSGFTIADLNVVDNMSHIYNFSYDIQYYNTILEEDELKLIDDSPLKIYTERIDGLKALETQYGSFDVVMSLSTYLLFRRFDNYSSAESCIYSDSSNFLTRYLIGEQQWKFTYNLLEPGGHAVHLPSEFSVRSYPDIGFL